MQEDRIIEKSKQLGLKVDESLPKEEQLSQIASQTGVDIKNQSNYNKLENKLDSLIFQKNESNISSPDYSGVTDIEDKPLSFGEEEYNAAKNEDGTYDKDYYKNREEELNKKVEEAQREKDTKTKEVADLDENGNAKWGEGEVPKSRTWENGKETTEGMPTKEISKSKKEQLKDNVNLLKAKKERMDNKISSLKSKAYQASHPVEALKNQAKNKIKNVAKDSSKKAGKTIGKVLANGMKKLGIFLLTNPIALLILGTIFFILLLLIILSGASGGTGNTGDYQEGTNFNETTLVVDGKTYDLKEYVVLETYASIEGIENLTSDQIKALLIIIKTNALADSNYSSTSHSNLNVSFNKYSESMEIDSEEKKVIDDYYEDVYALIYIDSTYSGKINSLSSSDHLDYELDDLKNYDGSYENILKNYFENKGIINKKLYNLNEEKKVTEIPKGSCNTNENCNENLFTGTILTKEEFANKLSEYYNFKILPVSSYHSSEFVNGFKIFVDNADLIYDSAVNNNLNPEMVVLRAYSEGFMPGIDHNYWGLYCSNTGGGRDCTHFSSFSDALTKPMNGDNSTNHGFIIELTQRRNYGSLTNWMQTYSHIGAKWYNPGGDSLGGCYYVDYIKSYLGDDRYNYLKNNVCNNNAPTCTTLNEPGCTETTPDDQIAYRDWQIDKMLNNRKLIFGLEKDICSSYICSGSNSFWWPIGSDSITSSNGKPFATGTPSSTNISSQFGYRVIEGNTSYHGGLDIKDDCGKNIIASKSGTVVITNDTCPTKGSYGNGCGGTYGNYVKISHNDGIETVYAHMSLGSVLVEKGETVSQGQVIGEVGSSGSSTNCHLHFEVNINGARVDPVDYIDSSNPRQ